ncbi:MAG: hypothetical protein PHE83_13460 [Opitutaceae bacterium]|nr:hypothetical protein [Opitutaceae bacterium]
MKTSLGLSGVSFLVMVAVCALCPWLTAQDVTVGEASVPRGK